MRYLRPFKVLDSSGSIVYNPMSGSSSSIMYPPVIQGPVPSGSDTCPSFQTKVAPNKFMYNQSVDPLGYCQYDCGYWCPGFDCKSACKSLINQPEPVPFSGECACFNNNIAANANQYLTSNSGNSVANCIYDCGNAYNCKVACPGFDCVNACNKLLGGGSVVPQPVTLPPGTLPPGTLPPGTLPPGTLLPVTLPPGTLLPVNSCPDFNSYVVPYLDYSNPDPSMCNTECNHYCSTNFDCNTACNNALFRQGSSVQNLQRLR